MVSLDELTGILRVRNDAHYEDYVRFSHLIDELRAQLEGRYDADSNEQVKALDTLLQQIRDYAISERLELIDRAVHRLAPHVESEEFTELQETQRKLLALCA